VDPISAEELMANARRLDRVTTIRWKYRIAPSHRTVPKANWQYQLARAFMFSYPKGPALFAKFSGFSASTVSKIRDWSYGVEYADMALNVRHRIPNARKESLIDAMNSLMSGIEIVDFKVLSDAKSLRATATSVWYSVQIPHYGFTDVEAALVNLARRESITIKKKIAIGKNDFKIIDVELGEHDLQAVQVFFDGKAGVRMEMQLSPTTGPMEMLRTIFNTGIGRVSSWSVERRNYLIKEDIKMGGDAQFDYMAGLESGGICRVTQKSIEKDLFGDYVSEHHCLAESLKAGEIQDADFDYPLNFGGAHMHASSPARPAILAK